MAPFTVTVARCGATAFGDTTPEKSGNTMTLRAFAALETYYSYIVTCQGPPWEIFLLYCAVRARVSVHEHVGTLQA